MYIVVIIEGILFLVKYLITVYFMATEANFSKKNSNKEKEMYRMPKETKPFQFHGTKEEDLNSQLESTSNDFNSLFIFQSHFLPQSSSRLFIH